jgi:hypothetical protein
MRTLTEQEANELGCFFNSADISGGTGAFIEATVSQLAELGVGTPCGGEEVFSILADNGYEHRKVRGYLANNMLWSIICIKIQTEKTALKIEKLLADNDALLRFDGQCDPSGTLAGFMMFEDE